jgi:hypothetical protein
VHLVGFITRIVRQCRRKITETFPIVN